MKKQNFWTFLLSGIFSFTGGFILVITAYFNNHPELHLKSLLPLESGKIGNMLVTGTGWFLVIVGCFLLYKVPAPSPRNDEPYEPKENAPEPISHGF